MKIVLLRDKQTGEELRVEEQHLADVAYEFFCRTKWTDYRTIGVDLKIDDEVEYHECDVVKVYDGTDNIPEYQIWCLRMY